ncbi:MAG: PEGA domain-containing protein [Gemmataceae bacterium]
MSAQSHSSLQEQSDQHAEPFLRAWENWDGEHLPDLKSYLPQNDPEVERSVLRELIRIDLEQHWKRGHQVYLDYYLHRDLGLGPRESLPVEFILDEYAVRSLHVDVVNLREYQVRFPEQFAEMKQRLLEAEPNEEGRLSFQVPPNSNTRKDFLTETNTAKPTSFALDEFDAQTDDFDSKFELTFDVEDSDDQDVTSSVADQGKEYSLTQLATEGDYPEEPSSEFELSIEEDELEEDRLKEEEPQVLTETIFPPTLDSLPELLSSDDADPFEKVSWHTRTETHPTSESQFDWEPELGIGLVGGSWKTQTSEKQPESTQLEEHGVEETPDVGGMMGAPLLSDFEQTPELVGDSTSRISPADSPVDVTASSDLEAPLEAIVVAEEPTEITEADLLPVESEREPEPGSYTEPIRLREAPLGEIVAPATQQPSNTSNASAPRRSSGWSIVWVLLLVGVGVFFVSRMYLFPGRSQVSIIVTTTPPNSRLFVDGKFQGETNGNPLRLPSGTYTLRVEQPGYESKAKTIAIAELDHGNRSSNRWKIHFDLKTQTPELPVITIDPLTNVVKVNGESRPLGEDRKREIDLGPKHRCDLELLGYSKVGSYRLKLTLNKTTIDGTPLLGLKIRALPTLASVQIRGPEGLIPRNIQIFPVGSYTIEVIPPSDTEKIKRLRLLPFVTE